MVIGICGGSCSGKTVLAQQFVQTCVLPMDNFYFGKSKMVPPYNFDHPDAIDLAQMADVLHKLKQGQSSVTIPKYDMKLAERTGVMKLKNGKHIVVEGIFSLFTKELRDLIDFSIFLDIPSYERLKRRMIRDVAKNRSSAETLQWSVLVEQMHEQFIEPQKQFADLVVKGW